MDLINIILITVFFIDIILILISFTDNSKKSTHIIWYAINIIAISSWVMNMIVFRAASASNVLIYSKFLYVTASLIVSTFYYFTFLFPQKDKNYKLHGILIAIANLAIIYLSLFTNSIVSGARVVEIGENEFYTGNLYWIYAIYILLFLSLSFFRLFIKSFRSTDSFEKAQLLYLALGYTVAGIIPMYTNLILPWIGINNYNWIGPTATIIMVLFFTYAVTKYKLFNLKIITAEIFIFTLWIFTVIKTFLPSSLDNSISRLSFFVLTIIVGLLLIRSVKNEVAQREKLRELDELKSELISLATHHISTPLTAVKGYVSLIQEGHYGNVPAEMEETLSIVDRSTTNMANILRDFLDVSRVDNNQLQYNFERQDIVFILKEVFTDQKFNAEKRGLHLEINTPIDSYVVSIDKDKFKQAINNIIENAIRHTKQGSITVEFSVKENTPIIKIIDSSDRKFPVISKKLSQKFTKIGKESEVNVISTGLGIYVAKQIIEAHKGNLSIDTEIDSTAFLVTLNRG